MVTQETANFDGGGVEAAARLAEVELFLPYRRERGVPRTRLVERGGRTHQVVLTTQTAEPGWKLQPIAAGVLLAAWRNPDTWLLVDPGSPGEQVWEPAALRMAWAEAGIPSEGGSATGPQEDPQPLAFTTQDPQWVAYAVVGVLLGLVLLGLGAVRGTATPPLLAGVAVVVALSAIKVQRYVREVRYAWWLRGARALKPAGRPARRGRPPRPVVVAAVIAGAYGVLYLVIAVGWLVSTLLTRASGWNVFFLVVVEPLLLLFIYVSYAGVREALSGASRRVTIPLHFTGWFGWLGFAGIVATVFAGEGWSRDLIAPALMFAVLVLPTAYAGRQLARPESLAWFTRHADLG